MGWNPLASTEAHPHPVPSSDGEAVVYARQWSGRERLAYEDQLTARFLDMAQLGDDEDDEPSDADAAKAVRIATMRLVATSLTLVRAEGFPPVPTEDGAGVEDFDPTDERHLLALTESVYGELVAIALAVQPLPGMGAATSTPTTAAETATGEAGDADEADDPSPTPPTPPAARGAARRRTPARTRE